MSIVRNVIFVFNLTFANERTENETLFNLGETPFINEGKPAAYFSYSFNQGPPSLIVDEWQVPDNNKNLLFNEYKAGLSIGGRFSFVYKKIIGNKLEFNSSHTGIKTTPTINYFGIKYKIYKSENYYPDYSIGLNNQELLSIDFMLGSMRERLKYYAYAAIGFYHILPFPYKYTAGISYEIIKNFDLLMEIQPVGDNDDNFNALLVGLKFTTFQYMSIHCSLYYFDFKFNNSIPSRDGLTWQDPSYIMTVPKKDQYYLISLRLSFALNEKVFK